MTPAAHAACALPPRYLAPHPGSCLRMPVLVVVTHLYPAFALIPGPHLLVLHFTGSVLLQVLRTSRHRDTRRRCLCLLSVHLAVWE